MTVAYEWDIETFDYDATAEDPQGGDVLEFHVEVIGLSCYWERIASFNCLTAARCYAVECQKVNQRFRYRVKHRTRIMYDETAMASEAILDKHLGAAI